MLAGRGRKVLLLAGLLALAPARGRASEESELLTAKGELAYNTGRLEDARTLLESAVAADPTDPDAHYALGLALAKLGRWDGAQRAFQQAVALRPDFPQAETALKLAQRGGEPPPTIDREVEEEEPLSEFERVSGEERQAAHRPWSVHASTGVEYDSNVELAGRGHSVGGVDNRGDVGFILTGGGYYDVLSRENALVRLEYDIYQDLHPEIDDFDFNAQEVVGTVSYAVRPEVWIGAQGGWNYYLLGRESYLSEPFVLPFMSYLEGDWGMTQLNWRWGQSTYLSAPFHEVRDGPTMTIGASQTYYPGGGRYLTVGYAYGQENPDNDNGGSDYKLNYYQGYIAGGFPAWWQTVVDLMYLYRYDDYRKPQSFADFRKGRYDNEHNMFAQVTRPINEHLKVAVAYYGEIHPSNIPLFDYRRSVVSGIVEVTY